MQYVHHYSLGVRDCEKSAEFYKDFLGFRLIPRPALGFPGIWLKLATVQLHIIQRDEEHPGPQGLPWAMHTAFQTANLKDLDEMEQKLIQKEIEYRRVVQVDSGIHQIFFKDPDGYNIEFGYYPD
ncbi:MAG: VOC family protein [Desulfobacterales bacterium]|nr:VOC family protein [Desulfobacterales bacterium]